jgi:hypothetical protein
MQQQFIYIGTKNGFMFAKIVTYKKKWTIYGRKEFRSEDVIYRRDLQYSQCNDSWKYLDNGFICYEANRLADMNSANFAFNHPSRSQTT